MTSRQDRRCYRRFIRMFVPSFSLFQPFCFFPLLVRTGSIGEPRLKRWRARNFLFLLATRHEFHRSPSLSSARAFSLLEMHCSSVCRRLCFRKRNGIPMPAENRFPRRNTDGSNACFFFKNRFRIIRRTINYFLKILSFLFILNSLSLFFFLLDSRYSRAEKFASSREMLRAALKILASKRKLPIPIIMQLHSSLDFFDFAFRFRLSR